MKLTILALFSTLLLADETAPKSFSVQVSGNPEGKSVILIPGLSSSGDVWRDTVAHLSPKYRCHVLTLAGFAGQPRYSDAPFLAQVRDDLTAYIKSAKLDKPILMGHSLGGHMALWVASANPKIAGPLVIVDSLPHLGFMMNADPVALRKQAEGMRLMLGSQTKEQYAAYLKSSKMLETLVSADGLAEVTKWSLASDPVAVGNAMFELYTTDLREEISKIESPALILTSWIAYRQFSTREQSLALVTAQYGRLENKSIRVSDTAKHFIMLDDPKWFLAQLESFLK